MDGETIQINGVPLYVRRYGDPALPPLVIAHGGPTWDGSYLPSAAEALSDVRHVLLPDLRGNGRSARGLPVDALQPALVADDLRGLASHVGADRVDLLGFSWGASIAAVFADRHADALRSVVLASACLYRDDLDPLLAALPDWRARSALARDTDESSYVGAPDGALSRAMAHDSLPLNVWDESRWPQWRSVLDGIVFSDDWMHAYRAGGVRRLADPPAALRAAGVPVLILHGAREMSFPVSLAERLHADVPGSRLALVPDAAHMAHFDNPAAWTAAVREFLG